MNKYGLLFVTILLSGCVGNNGQSTVPNQQNQKILSNNNQEDFISLGDPSIAFAPSQYATPIKFVLKANHSCLNLSDENTPISIGTKVAEAGYSTNISYSEMLNRLGASLSLNVVYSDFAANIVAEIEQTNQKINNSISFSNYAKMYVPVSIRAGTAHNSPEPDNYRICGTHYVSSVSAGITFLSNIVVSFDNKQDKQSVTLSGKLNYSDFVAFAGSLDKLDSKIRNNMRITIELAQLGGDSTAIFKILDAQSKNSAKTDGLYLSSVNVDTALKMLNIIQNYIGSDQYSGGLREQRKYIDDLSKYSQLKHLYTYIDNSLALTPYQNIKSKLKNNLRIVDGASFDITDEHYGLLLELVKELSSYQRFVDFISEYSGVYDEQPIYIANAERNHTQLVNTINEMQMIRSYCYDGLAINGNYNLDCEQEITQQILNAKNIVNSFKGEGNYKVGLELISSKQGIYDGGEYLIYLGKMNNAPLFVTYAYDLYNSFYAPGTLYVIENNKLTSILKNSYYTQAYFFQLNNAVFNNSSTQYISYGNYTLTDKSNNNKIPDDLVYIKGTLTKNTNIKF